MKKKRDDKICQICGKMTTYKVTVYVQEYDKEVDELGPRSNLVLYLCDEHYNEVYKKILTFGGESE